MKKRVALICAVALCLTIFCVNIPAVASTPVPPTDKPIGIAINGEDIDCSSAPPQIINGKVMVPIEIIEKFCGARVDYCSTFNMVFVDYPIDYSAFDDTNNTVTLEQEKAIAWEWINRFCKSGHSVGSKDIDVLEKELQQTNSLLLGLKQWGTLNEYKLLREKLIDTTSHLSRAFFYKIESTYYDLPESALYTTKSATEAGLAYNSLLEVRAEIDSLKKQGLL